jgi:hypothetical protein
MPLKSRVFGHWFCISISLLILAFSPLSMAIAAPEATTNTDSPEHAAKVALIKEFLDAARATRNAEIGMNAVMDAQLKGIQVAMDNRINDSKLSPAEKEEVKAKMIARANQQMARAKQFIAEEINIGKLVTDSYVQLYDKYFSTQEIKDMVAWYRSPTGQKILDVTPQLTQELSKTVTATLVPKIQQMQEQLKKEDAHP